VGEIEISTGVMTLDEYLQRGPEFDDREEHIGISDVGLRVNEVNVASPPVCISKARHTAAPPLSTFA